MRASVLLAALLGTGLALAGPVSDRTGGTVDPAGVTWTDLGGTRRGALSSADALTLEATFAAPTNVTFYSLSCPADAAADAEGYVPTMARDIALYGSNDGADWTLVDEEPYSIGWKPGETRTWICAAPEAYSRYWLCVTANNGGAATAVAGWGLYAPAKRKGATYYVDAAKGDDARTAEAAQSAATPWRTISKAAAAMVGGDTALVAPGVYREQVTMDKYHAAGTAVDPMTFRALDPEDRPIVSGAQLLDPSGWRETVVTNFEGREVACLVREIGWKTPALFAGLKRLVVAHEPEQVNGDDPYELEYMRTVSETENPEPCGKARLVDSEFFVQPERDYWAGATLMVYDGYSNFIAEQPVVGYDPATHSVTTGTFSVSLGPDHGKGDKWALKNHLGVLDAPGEFYVAGTAAPYRLYLVPPQGVDLATLAAVRYDYGFSTAKGGVVIDGFRFQSQAGAGFYGKTNPSRNLRVRNCEFCHILGDGADLRFWHSAGFERCVVSANTDNGISFANGVNCHVFDCAISTNANNGIWSGTGGGKAYFNDTGLVVRGCDIFDQAGRRSHADNFQMHMNDNVVIEGCRLTQKGEQNGWCQYTGHLVFRNNVLTGGPFGFGSVRYADISHNVFDSSQLRFDAHLDDHPEYGAWYCPVGIAIYANVIRTSSIAYPTSRLVDRFAAFDVAGNRYLFNSESDNARKTWDWAGRVITVKPGTLLVANEPAVDTAQAGAAKPFETVCQITWCDRGFVIPLYRDAQNYYWFGLGNNASFNRVTNGVNAVLATYKAGTVGAAHGRAVEVTNRVTSVFSPDGISFSVEKNGVGKLSVTDPDANARAVFAGSLQAGFGSETNASSNAWVQLVSATLGERREDFATLDNWTVISGKVSATGAKGYSGIGFGAGSVMTRTNPVPAVVDLTEEDLASVVTPDGLPVGPLDGLPQPDPPVAVRYTYAFDVRGGSAVAAIVAEAGTPIAEPVSVRAGYEFVGWSLDGATKAAFPPTMTEDDRTYLALWRPLANTAAELKVLQWRVNCPNSKPADSSAYAVGLRNAVATNGVDVVVVDNYKSVDYLAPIVPEGYALVGKKCNGSGDGNIRVVGWKAAQFRQLIGGGSLEGENHKPATNSTTVWTVLEDVQTGWQYLVLNAWYSWMKGKTIENYLRAQATQLAALRTSYPAARVVFCSDYSGMANESCDFWTTYGGRPENVLAALVSATGLVPVQAGGDMQWTLVDVGPRSANVAPVADGNVSASVGYLSALQFGDNGTVVIIQ